jgi:hypothetical protein
VGLTLLNYSIYSDHDPALRSLHHADADSVTAVFEEYAISIFMIKGSKLRQYSVYIQCFDPKEPCSGEGHVLRAQSGPI